VADLLLALATVQIRLQDSVVLTVRLPIDPIQTGPVDPLFVTVGYVEDDYVQA
jgi:hypothetical protein